MDKLIIAEKVWTFIVDAALDGDGAELEYTTPLLELRILDSFSIVSLCTFMEAEFGISLPIESLPVDRLTNINLITDLVVECRNDG